LLVLSVISDSSGSVGKPLPCATTQPWPKTALEKAANAIAAISV
jgi:hypothetical protein